MLVLIDGGSWVEKMIVNFRKVFKFFNKDGLFVWKCVEIVYCELNIFRVGFDLDIVVLVLVFFGWKVRW